MTKENDESEDCNLDSDAAETLQRLASLGELTAGIVHQARNRMTGALAFAQVGKRGADEKMQSLFANIETELLSCMSLFESLLRASRAPETTTDPSPLDVGRRSIPDIISAVTGLTRSHLRMKGVELCVKRPDDMPLVLTDNDTVVHALLNLILNALHVSPPGSTVTLEVGVAGRAIEVRVSDEGPGVPVDLREEIFQSFFTTKAPGVGTGLGLSTSLRQLQAIGGDLDLEESDKGASFVVTLPIAPAGDSL